MVDQAEQQAVPVAQESLFDVQPQVSTIDNGPEPSIREMVRSFYNRHAVINPDAVTEQYLAALSHPCKSGEGAEAIAAVASLALMYLQTGFLECPGCGAEVPTKDLDAASELASVFASKGVDAGVDTPVIFDATQTREAETWASIAQWCEDTFGPVTMSRTAERANEEMQELLADPENVIEAADVCIVLSRYSGLWDAVERKMAINRARTWDVRGDGTGYHVKPLNARGGA